MAGYTIGIDIGGTNTDFGLVDESGNILHEERLSTVAYPTLTELLNELIQRIKNAINAFPSSGTLQGIGIGAPQWELLSGDHRISAQSEIRRNSKLSRGIPTSF